MIDFTNGGSTLPKEWEWLTFNEIAIDHKYAIVDGPFGSNLKTSEYIQGNDGVPVLTTKNIDNGYSEDLLRYISFEKFYELKRSEVKGGDIIIAKIGSVGKHTIYPNNQPSAIIPANLMKITLNKRVKDKFVNYYLDTEIFKDQLSQITTATAQPAFGITKFKKLYIPVPLIHDQERIVSKIEELFTQLDAAEASLKRAKNNLKRYKQSLLQAAVTGELTKEWREAHKNELEPANKLLERIKAERKAQWEAEIIAKGKDPAKEKYKEPKAPDVSDLPELPEGWCWNSMDQICSKVTDGFHNTPKPTEDGFPYVLATHVKNEGIDFNNCLHVSEADHNELYQKTHPNKGDLLVVNIGIGSGTSAIVDVDFPFSFKNVAILKRINYINEKYLNYYLIYKRESILKNITKGGAQPFLSLEVIRRIPVPLPSQHEQIEIIIKMEDFLLTIKHNEEAIKKSLKRIDRLRQSILYKAFSGKLIQPQKEEIE